MIANYYQRTFTIIRSNFGGFLHYKDIIQQRQKNIIYIKIMICWIIVNVRWERLAIIRFYLSIIASPKRIFGQFLGHGRISRWRTHLSAGCFAIPSYWSTMVRHIRTLKGVIIRFNWQILNNSTLSWNSKYI